VCSALSNTQRERPARNRLGLFRFALHDRTPHARAAARIDDLLRSCEQHRRSARLPEAIRLHARGAAQEPPRIRQDA
jgi:hypothetical protein